MDESEMERMEHGIIAGVGFMIIIFLVMYAWILVANR